MEGVEEEGVTMEEEVTMEEVTEEDTMGPDMEEAEDCTAVAVAGAGAPGFLQVHGAGPCTMSSK